MKTRDILKAVLFLAAIMMVTAACNKKDETPTIDFNMALPANWNYTIDGHDEIVYYAVSPRQNANDSVTEDIVVFKYSRNNADLETFAGSFINQLAKDTSYHPISVTDTSINGEEAIKLTHFQTLTAVNQAKDTLIMYAKMQKYIMINKSSGYVVSFNALRTTFDEFHPIFDAIIATFTFKE